MIISVLNYNTGEINFYNYTRQNQSNEAVMSWLKYTYNYKEDEISFMTTSTVRMYIDPRIRSDKFTLINE